MKDIDKSQLTSEQKAALAQVEAALKMQPTAVNNSKAILIKYCSIALFFLMAMAAVYLMLRMQSGL